MIYPILANQRQVVGHRPTVVAIRITDYQHVRIYQPYHNVIDSPMYLTKVNAVIGRVDQVFDQFISVKSSPIIKGEYRIVG
jgi:hypothetical protein